MNKTKIVHIVILFCTLLVLQSCNVSRFLGEDEFLYDGARIKFSNEKWIADKNSLQATLEDDLYPDANKKFLGLFYTRIWLYQKINTKKEKGFKHWLKHKVGKKPILLSDVKIDLMEKVLNKGMQDQGYFNTYITHKVRKKNKHAKVKYKIQHQQQKIIDSIIYPKTNTELDSIFSNYKNLSIHKNDPYNLNKLNKDRNNLASDIRSLGYFDFDINDIYFVIDTSIAANLVNVYYKIKPPETGTEHKKYYINTINVYHTFEASNPDEDNRKDYVGSFYYKDYAFRGDYKYVGKRTLFRNFIIEPNDLFSVKKYEYTSERLTNLDVYDFVNINYYKNQQDSLTVDIKLTPGKYQSFKVDVEANTSNRSFLGSSVALSYNNRNLLKGAESLTIKTSGGTEFQMIDSKAALNILDFTAEANLAIPRLLFPKTKKIKSSIPPTTNFTILENYQQWLEYYTLNSISLSYNYDWRTEKAHHHKISPLFFNVISLINTTSEFDEILDENPILEESFDNIFIIGRNYNYSVSSQKNYDDKSYVYFTGLAEFAGSGSYLIAKIIKPNVTSPYEIFDTPFSQYAKFDAELRHYWKPKMNHTIVTRFNAGIGFAYGNSDVLPYSKQFYVGGPNTIRAFAFRSVGPGRFSSANDSDDGEVNPIEQSGDIKLLMNIEHRFNIYKFIKGAFFVDAGNVWLREEDPDREDSQFKFDEFYKQLALGTGFGFRFDFDFFVIRTDLGIPIYKPYNNSGERWINQFPEQGFKDWRTTNFSWNIAIGYPF